MPPKERGCFGGGTPNGTASKYPILPKRKALQRVPTVMLFVKKFFKAIDFNKLKY